MLIKEPICIKCKHFDLNTFTCAAFPANIPIDIIDGENDHTKPLPEQDNDIVFENIEEV